MFHKILGFVHGFELSTKKTMLKWGKKTLWIRKYFLKGLRVTETWESKRQEKLKGKKIPKVKKY